MDQKECKEKGQPANAHSIKKTMVTKNQQSNLNHAANSADTVTDAVFNIMNHSVQKKLPWKFSNKTSHFFIIINSAFPLSSELKWKTYLSPWCWRQKQEQVSSKEQNLETRWMWANNNISGKFQWLIHRPFFTCEGQQFAAYPANSNTSNILSDAFRFLSTW